MCAASSGSLSIKYTISNGAGSAVGEISVVRIPAPDKLLPPRVEPDTASGPGGRHCQHPRAGQ